MFMVKEKDTTRLFKKDKQGNKRSDVYVRKKEEGTTR